MKIGLLGCGSIAYWCHLPALRRMRGAVLVAAADPDPQARARAARAGRVPVFERPADLLAGAEVDAVVICAPTRLHAELAIAAAEAGKHFYLEKPMATSADDARRVVAATAAAGVVGVLGFNRRLHPLYQQARRLLVEGRIGPVRAVQSAFCEPTPLRAMPEWKRHRTTGGGVLLDLASHHVDLLRWFLDDEIAAATARLESATSEHDSARLELMTRGGVQVQSFFSFRAGLADFVEFYGERGTLRVDRHSPRLELRVPRRFGYGVRRARVPPTGAVLAWRLVRWTRPSLDPSYRRSLQAFVDRLHGRGDGAASLEDGLRSLEVILGAERAACAPS
jgi:myo-inositol 2-dehydrogenase / D-chiro-inositol 1-dehydrogenase